MTADHIYTQRGAQADCPKCGADADMIETTIQGKTWQSFYCNCCGQGWKAPVDRREVQGR